MVYRPHIDGLRAVAVLPVIFSHLGLYGFGGGFVGVDVFFVISGYLITSIILHDIHHQKFSIIKFYERRARRIIPALAFVVLGSTIAAYFIVAPNDFKDYSQSLAAVALFVSNFLFWTEAGYFAEAAIYKPLLHTWSLSVEEQFYIFLPLFLVVLATFRANLIVWLTAICVASLALAVYMTERSADTAFYLLPFRFWELGVGSLLAAAARPPLPQNRALRELIAGLGLAFIVVCVFAYDESTQFPGLAALLPCLGAALIIYAGDGQSTLIGRLLSWRPVVFLGLISYSLYLCHWPIIVFYQYWRADSGSASSLLFNPMEMFCILLVSIAFAAFSWRYVEQPFRRKDVSLGFSRTFVFTATGGAMATAFAFGTMVHVGNGWPWRFAPEAVALAQAASSRPPMSCLDTKNNDRESFESLMVMGEEGPLTTVLWGDSHAAQLSPGLHAAARRANQRLGYYGVCGCPPVIGLERVDGKQFQCSANNEWMLKKIAESPEITTVVLASRLQYYVEGTTYGPIEAGQSGPILTQAGSERTNGADQGGLLMKQLGHMVDRIQASGKRVVLIYPVPEIGHDVPRTLFRLHVVGENPENLAVPQQDFINRTSTTFAGLDQISGSSNALTIHPHELLCNADECKTVIGGDVLYRDADHLTVEGSNLLSHLFDRIFEDPRPETRADRS